MNAAITRFHVALNVHDLERSLAFYQALLDVAADKVRPGFARFTLEDPPLVLSLAERERPRRESRVAHFGIRVASAEAFQQARERLARAGLVDREERGILCCHATEDKVWAVDPDGNEWEFYDILDDHPEAGRGTQPANKKRCC